MFCRDCGKRCIDDANYCFNCGFSMIDDAANKSVSKTVSFDEYKVRKEQERRSRFEPNAKKSKLQAKGKGKNECEISINIGYMRLSDEVNLKKCRGKTLPIKVLPSADRKAILEKATKKHANHDKNIHENLDHVLLFPDGNEVLHLPGTSREFILKEYREDIGKNYNRLTLYIAKRSDYILSELPDNYDIDELENDDDNEIENQIEETSMYHYTHRISNESDEQETLPTSFVDVDLSLSQAQAGTSELKIACPTCQKLFPVSVIAEHADLCCDIWVGDIPSESPPSSPHVQSEINEESSLRNEIDTLAQCLAEPPKRLNIRRKYLWSDFKESRLKEKFKPGDKVKIVFMGEPAIDDGGPKREFFSGTISCFCY